ncbi:MAG TPA: hypothetical protein VMD08_12330 [Candidatus Baltobacteraceae bacterium]|nr:hypothetical protein [Candidatus Baltobacteraceae bacterium]
MNYSGRWTAGRVIAAIITWTLISNALWILIVAVSSLVAAARWDWEMVGRHGLRGLYACLTAAAVVLVCRSLYYRTAEGRGR